MYYIMLYVHTFLADVIWQHGEILRAKDPNS